jgi:hypothetical protein
VIPEIDIWRAADLMLKRYGEKALEESATHADELATDGDHDGAVTWRRITAAVGQLANTTTARAGALIGTDPKQRPNPMASSADPRCAACRACRKKEGGRGKPCVTIGLARFPRVPSKRSCLAVFVEIHESAAAKFWVGNPGTTYPGDTTPMAWEASAGPGLEDPPGPRLIDVCTAYEEIRLRGACSNLVRCCPRRCPVRCGGIRGLEFYLLTL